MPADSVQAAGERFARDMRRIREARDVTRDDVHEETRIARTLIETFEQDGLFDHPAFNRVYLRSFVRAYAGCIDVDPSVALDHLERAMNGEYDNNLANQILGTASGSEAWPPEPEVPDTDTPDTPGTEDESSAAPSEDAPESSTGADTPSRTGPGDVEPDELAKDEPPTGPVGDADLGERGAEEKGEKKGIGPQGETDDEFRDERDDESDDALGDASDDASDGASSGPSWAAGMRDQDDDAPPRPPAGASVGTPRPVDGDEPSPSTDPLEPTSREGAPNPRRTSRSGSTQGAGRGTGQATGSSLAAFFEKRGTEVAIGGVALVVAIIAIAGAVAFFGGEDEPQAVEPAPIAADTADTAADTAADTTAPTREAQPPPANVTLGETLHLTVRASEDVSGIRIRRDTDLRRPYWIEEGQASVFPFSDRVVVEEELNRVDLYLERYPYPVTVTDGRVVINRDSARAFVDTLRGDPPALEATTDTIEIPPPAPPEPATDPNGESGTESGTEPGTGPDAETDDATGR